MLNKIKRLLSLDNIRDYSIDYLELVILSSFREAQSRRRASVRAPQPALHHFLHLAKSPCHVQILIHMAL